MKRRRRESGLTALAAALLSLALPACGGGDAQQRIGPLEDDVGDPCVIEGVDEGPTSGTLINTGSLDCLSGLCLQWEESPRAQCTQICETDEDCPEESASCPEGEPFVCVVASSIGSLACCKMCVCRTYLSAQQREGKIPTECETKTPSCTAL